MKVFDAQKLRDEVEAQRSRSNRLSEISTDAQNGSPGEYGTYPPLDRSALRNGYKLCIENAERLLTDARALAEAGRYRSAHRILLLVVEELGTALQLYEAARSGVSDWEGWWRRFASGSKDLQSASLGIEKREEPGAPAFVPAEMAHVNFDKKQKKFTAPIDDEDPELVGYFEKELAYTEHVLKVLPSHAFERWEYELTIQQSPEFAPLVLYARIEELVSQDPAVKEKDLLTAIARDLGRSKDVFAAGFERWKDISPKARAYVDLMRRLQQNAEARE